MKLEDQCCTLEQAKRLKELGVAQDSYASWFGDENHTVLDFVVPEESNMRVAKYVFVLTTEPFNSLEEDHRGDINITKPIAAAYNVAELGIMLGIGSNLIFQVLTGKGEYYDSTKWLSKYSDDTGTKRNVHEREASARADMLIDALEKNLLSFSDVNRRIKNTK